MNKKVRGLLTMTRERYDLPLNDVDLLYDVLTLCPLGIPLNKLCVMLGLDMSDFSTAWDLLHKLEKRYKTLKLKHWGGKGSPAWIAIERDNPIANYYQDLAPVMREARKDGDIPHKKPEPGKPEKLKKYKKFLNALPQKFTRADIARVSQYSSHAVVSIANRWLSLGKTKLYSQGGRGYANPYIYLKVDN